MEHLAGELFGVPIFVKDEIPANVVIAVDFDIVAKAHNAAGLLSAMKILDAAGNIWHTPNGGKTWELEESGT